MRRRDLEQLATALLPERANDLYIVELPSSPGSRAWACRTAPPAVRQSLIDSGEWEGQRPTIAMLSPDTIDEPGLLVHELAHLAGFSLEHIEDCEPSPTALFVEFLAVLSVDTPQPPHRTPPVDHPVEFIRRACHLLYRASRLGYDIPPPALRIGWELGLPATIQFIRLLGSEPERLARNTFREIDAIPMPPKFVALYKDATNV